MVILIICYSQILKLKFLLEEAGLFAEIRMNRDLNILSNGKILTMNDVQKEFIQTMANQDHVEKDVLITGPVGSGKTLLGIEALNIKKSHYMKKYEINPRQSQNRLRVIIWIGTDSEDNILKQQLINNMPMGIKDCLLEIHTNYVPISEKLNKIFQANENYNSYLHTLVMIDETMR